MIYRHIFLVQNLLIADKLLIIPSLISACCSFRSVSSNTLKPASMILSDNSENFMVFWLGWGSGSSASSRTICFRIAIRSSDHEVRHAISATCKTFSASYIRTWAICWIYCVCGKHLSWGTKYDYRIIIFQLTLRLFCES